VEQRKSMYATMINAYYTLATDFYEYGWGESFHFATRWVGESLAASILRHEHYLAARMGLTAGQRVLDMGCGVGGPARNIARFTGASVTGINNNDYQVSRATAKTAKAGLSDTVSFVKGDFMALPFAPATFDASYAIEATCHAPDRTACFAQVFRALKPGGVFAGYEWVTTPAFDATNPEHQRIKHGIEVGDGLPDITDGAAVVEALVGAGFEVEECRDLAPTSAVPWAQPFAPDYTSFTGLRTTPLGVAATHTMVWLLEAIGLAPKGTTPMHGHLTTAAKDLYRSCQLGIFTPMLFFKARKPASGKPATAPRSAAATPAASRGRSPSKPRAAPATPASASARGRSPSKPRATTPAASSARGRSASKPRAAPASASKPRK